MIIALDGPAGSGKSTIAKNLSETLQIEYIDSGAIYRALTLFAVEEWDGQVEGNEKLVLAYFNNNPDRIEIFWEDKSQRIKLNGLDVSQSIRDRAVTSQIKYIANDKGCREWVNNKMRSLAQQYSFVIDGRDIGTVVFPDAKYKFYLDAEPEIRAIRRAKELNLPVEGDEFERLCQEIRQRDEEDKNREIAPLKKADDAIFINTSFLNINEVVAEIRKYVNGEKLPEKGQSTY